MAEVKGIGSVVSTHLFGGGGDDEKWKKHQKKPSAQMKKIINTFPPSIVAGDFNSPNTCHSGTGELPYWTQKGVTNKNKNMFIKHITGVHTYLTGQGYQPLADSNKKIVTSHKNQVDWIYKNKGYKLLDIGTVDAIDKKISDHNWLYAQIDIG